MSDPVESHPLERLKESTVLAVDSADLAAIQKFQPTHVTTNPSIILKATTNPANRALIHESLLYAQRYATSRLEKNSLFLKQLFVNVGCTLLKHIPGTVSTQIDPRLSFDCDSSLSYARSLIDMYEDKGVARERILIKLAATWEGIQAAKQLEQEGIHCNMTLLFSLPQAVASAEAGATMIAPYVGRVTDWYRHQGLLIEKGKDPGVESTKQIYHYFKKFAIPTLIMGASFRNPQQIAGLNGCDIVTIGPQILEEFVYYAEVMERQLHPLESLKHEIPILSFDEKEFRLALNNEAMATEKLAEGIRKFSQDTLFLEQLMTF